MLWRIFYPIPLNFTVYFTEVDDIDPSQSPRKAKSAKGKRKKVKQSQHAAPRNAAELDMLRNLGDYLRREKERVTANKQLSYDELLQKAQTDLGIHHAEVASASKGGGKPSKSKAAAQVRAVAIEDDYEESYREHLRKKFLKEKAATGGSAAVGVGRKLYPITDADGEEDDDGARTVPHRTLETLQYTDSQQRLFERRLALEREIEAYNRSHKQPLPAGSAGTSTGHSTDTGTGNKRDESVTSTARRSSGDEDDDRVGHGSPPRSYKGRFDMSEALLSSPGLSSGGNTHTMLTTNAVGTPWSLPLMCAFWLTVQKKTSRTRRNSSSATSPPSTRCRRCTVTTVGGPVEAAGRRASCDSAPRPRRRVVTARQSAAAVAEIAPSGTVVSTRRRRAGGRRTGSRRSSRRAMQR